MAFPRVGMTSHDYLSTGFKCKVITLHLDPVFVNIAEPGVITVNDTIVDCG